MSQYEQFRLDQCWSDPYAAISRYRFAANSHALPVRLISKSLAAIAYKNLNSIGSDGTLAGKPIAGSHKN